MLIKELLSIDERTQALYYFELVNQKHESEKCPIYTAKMNLLYHLYFTEDMVQKAQACFDEISILKELKDAEGACELSALAAKHFEDLGDIHQAYLFLKEAYHRNHPILDWRNSNEKMSLLIIALTIVVFGQTASFNSLNETNAGTTERPIGT